MNLNKLFKKIIAVICILSIFLTNQGIMTYADSNKNQKTAVEEIEEIVEKREVVLDKFIDNLNIKKNSIERIDFLIGNEGEELVEGIRVKIDKKNVYINIEEGVDVFLPEDSSRYFFEIWNLKEINGLNLLNANNVKDMTSMFEGNIKLKKIDISSFCPNNLLKTKDMFRNNEELTYINIESLDTSKVEDMVGMFNMCPKLSKIEGLENMDTSSAESLDWMFYEDRSIKELDLSNWTVDKNISMKYCFYECSNLEKIYVSEMYDESRRKTGDFDCGTKGLTKLKFIEDIKNNEINLTLSENEEDIDELEDEKEIDKEETTISKTEEEPEEDLIEEIDKNELENKAETVKTHATISEIIEEEYDNLEKNKNDIENKTNNSDNNEVNEDNEKTNYIKDIKMVVAEKNEAIKIFEENGYKIINTNLNDKTEGEEIYIGYITTDNCEEAITGIGERWFNSKNKNPESYLGKYHKYNFYAITDFNNKQINTNEGSDTSARWVYLYQTKDKNAGSGITKIEIISDENNRTIEDLKEDVWTVVTNSNDNSLSDFNRSNKNVNHIYIRYTNKNFDEEETLIEKVEENTNNKTTKKEEELLMAVAPSATKEREVVLNKFVDKLGISKLSIENVEFVEGSDGDIVLADGIKAKIDGKNVYINIEKGVVAKLPKDSSNFFSKMYSLKEVKGLDKLNFNDVETMESMFATNNNLEKVDLSGVETNNLLNTNFMFNNCPKLTYINLGDIDTSKVVNMDSMFSYCPNLTKIDGIENMKTDSAKSLKYIFDGDKKITELNLIEWTVNENISMEDCFRGLEKLEKIYIISDKWNKNKRNINSKNNGTFGLTDIRFIDGSIDVDKIYKEHKNIFTLNGNILKLEKDIQLENPIKVENINLILDLNGKKLESPIDDYAIYVDHATFTLIDSTYDKKENKDSNVFINEIENKFKGKILGRSEKPAIYVNNSTVNLDGGYVSGADCKVEVIEEKNTDDDNDDNYDAEESDYISLTNTDYDTSGNVYLNGAPAVMVKDSNININGAFIKGGDGKSYKEQRGADGAIAILTMYEKEDCKINLNSGVILGGKGGDGIKCNVSGSAGEGFIINNQTQNIAEKDNPILHTTYAKEGGFGGGNGGLGINVIGNIKIDNIIKSDDIIITGGDGGKGDENDLKSFKRKLYFKEGEEAKLPEKYSSIDFGLVTNSKEQGAYGWCWIYANISVAETYMLKHYPDWCEQFLHKKTGEINLSEVAVAKARMHPPKAPLTNEEPVEIKHDHNSYSDIIVDNIWLDGGNSTMFSWITSGDRAMVPEEIAPQGKISCSDYDNNVSNSDKTIMYNKELVFITNGYWKEKLEEIKNAVIENGSVSIYTNVNVNSVYDKYIYNPLEISNHAMQIVGWDDSISRNNFKKVVDEKGKVYKPSVDGAFLVKDSHIPMFSNSLKWVSYDSYGTVSKLTFGPSNEYDYAYDNAKDIAAKRFRIVDRAIEVFRKKGNNKQKVSGISISMNSDVRNATITLDNGSLYRLEKDLHIGTNFIDLSSYDISMSDTFYVVINGGKKFNIGTDGEHYKIRIYTKVSDTNLESIEMYSNYLPKVTHSIKKGKNFISDSEFKKHIDNEYRSKGYIVEGMYSDADYKNRIFNFITDNKKVYFKLKKVFDFDGGMANVGFGKLIGSIENDILLNMNYIEYDSYSPLDIQTLGKIIDTTIYIKYDMDLMPTKAGIPLRGWCYENGEDVEIVKLNGKNCFKINKFDGIVKAKYDIKLNIQIEKPQFNNLEFNNAFDKIASLVPKEIYYVGSFDSYGFEKIRRYIFKGYMISLNGGKDYKGPTLKLIDYDLESDILLKPVFDLVKYKIEYELDGGVAKNNLESFTAEDSDLNEKIILNEPEKFGYLHCGWNIKTFDKKRNLTYVKFLNGKLTKNMLLMESNSDGSSVYISDDNIVTIQAEYSKPRVFIKYKVDSEFIENIKSTKKNDLKNFTDGIEIDVREDVNLYDFSNDLNESYGYFFKGWIFVSSPIDKFVLNSDKCIYEEFKEIDGNKTKLLKSIEKGGIVFNRGDIFDSCIIEVEPYLIMKKCKLNLPVLKEIDNEKIKNIVFTNKDYSNKDLKRINDELYTYEDNSTMYFITYKDVKYVNSEWLKFERMIEELSQYNVSGFELFDCSNVDLDVNIEYEFTNGAMWKTGYKPKINKKFNEDIDEIFNENNIKLAEETDFVMGFKVYGIYKSKVAKDYGYVDKLPRDPYLSYKVIVDVAKSTIITSNVLFDNIGINKTEITKINFTKEKPKKGTEKIIAKNLSAYINGTEVTYYVDRGIISMPNDSSYLFAGLSKVLEISGFNVINCDDLYNMQAMFKGNSELTKIDFSNIDFSKVENIKELFSGNKKLNTLTNFRIKTLKNAIKGDVLKDVNNLTLVKNNRELLSNEESIVEIDFNGGRYDSSLGRGSKKLPSWFIKGNEECVFPRMVKDGYILKNWVCNLDNKNYRRIDQTYHKDVKFTAVWEKKYSNRPIYYISDIKAEWGDNATAVKNKLKNAGYTVIDVDMNYNSYKEKKIKKKKRMVKSPYVYIGVKTTTNRNDAITDIIADVKDSRSDKGNRTMKRSVRPSAPQSTYYGVQRLSDSSKLVDFNEAAGGKYIYLFYTKNRINHYLGGQNPITGLTIDFGGNKHYKYNPNSQFGDTDWSTSVEEEEGWYVVNMNYNSKNSNKKKSGKSDTNGTYIRIHNSFTLDKKISQLDMELEANEFPYRQDYWSLPSLK